MKTGRPAPKGRSVWLGWPLVIVSVAGLAAVAVLAAVAILAGRPG